MRSHADSAPDSLRMVGTLLLLLRMVDHATRQRPGVIALTITELNVLGQIDRGADTPTRLAHALRLDPARVTHLTDRLVAGGFISRAVDPNDRRRWRLSLTPSGLDRLETGRADIRAVVAQLFTDMTDAEQAALVTGLAGARRALDARAVGAPGRVPEIMECDEIGRGSVGANPRHKSSTSVIPR